MDKTFPTYSVVIVPVPDIQLITKDKFKDYPCKDITEYLENLLTKAEFLIDDIVIQLEERKCKMHWGMSI
jgi:hypothetical protein